MNCIAIDDEPLSLELIKNYCSKINKIDLLQSFAATSPASVFIKNNKVDLIFCDIQMPSQTGLDFINSLENKPLVIFTTAHSEYALNAFDLHAIDYLLKPITFERFEMACKKALGIFDYQTKQREIQENCIFVRSEYALIKIPLADILFMESMDDYIHIHTNSGKRISTKMSIKKMTEKLPLNQFVRTHRSFLVPLYKIEAVRDKKIFIANFEIPISSNYESDFFKSYLKNHF